MTNASITRTLPLSIESLRQRDETAPNLCCMAIHMGRPSATRKALGSLSTDAGKLGRRFPYRMCSTNVHDCRTNGLPSGRPAAERAADTWAGIVALFILKLAIQNRGFRGFIYETDVLLRQRADSDYMTTSAPLSLSTLVALNDQRSGERESSMPIIGCDFHPTFQQIAFTDTETGEYEERCLHHLQEAEQFYRTLAEDKVRVGMEATGSFRWFRRLLAELGHELWLGNPTQIRASAPRRQKTDKRDARQLMKLLLEERFPRVW